jgi:hypothetical protein
MQHKVLLRKNLHSIQFGLDLCSTRCCFEKIYTVYSSASTYAVQGTASKKIYTVYSSVSTYAVHSSASKKSTQYTVRSRPMQYIVLHRKNLHNTLFGIDLHSKWYSKKKLREKPRSLVKTPIQLVFHYYFAGRNKSTIPNFQHVNTI